MFDSNGVFLHLAAYGRAGAVLLILSLSILAAASRIIRCASQDKIPSSTIWTGALIAFSGGFVFVAGFLNLLPQPSAHWLP